MNTQTGVHRFMTWNLLRQEWARPGWGEWRERRAGILRELQRRIPDVRAIQEETPEMVADLLEGLPAYDYASLPPEPQSGSGFLLRRDRCRIAGGERIPLPGDRAGMALLLETEAGRFRVVGTHFTPFPHNLPLRTESARRLLDWAAHQPEPLLMLGDFNSQPGDPAVELFLSAGFRDVLSNETGRPLDVITALNEFGKTEGTRIDYLFHSPPWRVLNARISHPPGSPSDHFPLLADLHLPPASARP